MSDLPRLSIITPSYNQAAFLEETIRSVLDQDYPNLEYMVIDGGSQDGSVDIIRKYADRLAWWTSERDSGQGDAINKGFARATGEIVAWINSDDYYLPGALQAAVRALMDNPACGLVYGDVLAIDGDGQPINVMTYDDWGLDDLMQFQIIGQPSVFVRRPLLEKSGFLDLSYHYLLDHELWLRVAQHGTMRYIRQRWSAARYHAGAKNVSQTGKYGKDAYRIIEWMASDPALAPHFRRLKRRIWAGAYRLDAHYLLDGNQYGPALRAYLRSLAAYPPRALPDWRRILFAAVSQVVNIDSLRSGFLARRKGRVAARLSQESTASPGDQAHDTRPRA